MAKKAKQKQLPGLEDEVIKEIDDAAEEYVTVRDKRMKLTEDEVTKRDTLLRAMQKHKRDSYKFDGKLVLVTADTKVKVKKSADPGEDEEDAD